MANTLMVTSLQLPNHNAAIRFYSYCSHYIDPPLGGSAPILSYHSSLSILISPEASIYSKALHMNGFNAGDANRLISGRLEDEQSHSSAGFVSATSEA